MATRAKQEPDNLALWNAVAKTDPAHTKRVNQRGGFTAINANYQIMEATRQFGPLGIGWGYDASLPMLMDGLVTVAVTLWHGNRENKFGPMPGAAELRGSNGKLDHDAPKKATTDAITKLLSQLGFNADVFLGLFDDNKYVEQVRAEFAQQPAANDEPAKVAGISKIKVNLRALKVAGDAIDDLSAFNELLASSREDLTKIKEAKHGWWTGDGEDFEGFAAWITRRRQELSGDGMVNVMIASLKQCQTMRTINDWMDANEKVVSELDGADSRKFQLAYELHLSGVQQMDRVTAGA